MFNVKIVPCSLEISVYIQFLNYLSVSNNKMDWIVMLQFIVENSINLGKQTAVWMFNVVYSTRFLLGKVVL
jgi:hypothetical protein